jgi:hypothetical protein
MIQPREDGCFAAAGMPEFYPRTLGDDLEKSLDVLVRLNVVAVIEEVIRFTILPSTRPPPGA